jgi:hypothetical protein
MEKKVLTEMIFFGHRHQNPKTNPVSHSLNVADMSECTTEFGEFIDALTVVGDVDDQRKSFK